MKLRFWCVGLLTLTVSTSGHAQTMWQMPIGVWPGNAMFNAFETERAFPVQPGKNLPRQGSPQTRVAPSVSALEYTPSLVVRRANMAKFIGKIQAIDPSGAVAFQQMLASTDIIDALGGEIGKLGLRADNVADAYTFCWVSAWKATRGDITGPDRATLQAVKAQSARALLAAPEFRSATNVTKQEFAEALLIQALILSQATDAVHSDPAALRKLSEGVKKAALTSNLDLYAMTLTDKGFVPAR